MRKLSRLEANKEARRVLNRNSVDLSYVQYSVVGTDIRLTGWLCKVDNSEFSTHQIEILIQEFQRRLPGHSISGEMDNWKFTSDYITFLGERHKSKGNEYFESVEAKEFDSNEGN